MPTLKQMTCSIELGSGNTKLKEYGARYSDGHVESFIAVPGTDIPFMIHLKSEGYIAPGIAFFVFIDGEYQCNRNRLHLKLPGEGVQPSEYETEFRVRQKEEKTSFGTFVARDWTFDKLNKVAADKAPNLNPDFTNNVGTIEVIVLRCRTDLDDAPRRKGTLDGALDDAQSETPTRNRAAKSVTFQQPSEGFFAGTFDGACDDMDLDGAGDDRPVGKGGRVRPNAPPGMYWESTIGAFAQMRSEAPDASPSEAHAANDMRNEKVGNLDDRKKAIRNKRMGGLDGHAGQPGVVINQWADRGRDDMQGDKYLGLQGERRDAYKQYLREGGEPVSSHAGPPNNHQRHANTPGFAPWQNRRQLPLQQNMQARVPGAILPWPARPHHIATGLERVAQVIQSFLQQNPNADHQQGIKDVATIQTIQHGIQQGHTGWLQIPVWLREELMDIENRRQYSIALQKAFPDFNWDPHMQMHTDHQISALQNTRLRKGYGMDTEEDLRQLYDLLDHRVKIFEIFLEELPARFSAAVSTSHIRERLGLISSQREEAYIAMREKQNAAQQPQMGGRNANYGQPIQFQQVQHRGGDATYNNKADALLQHHWDNPNDQGGNQGGWKQVGEGVWNGKQNGGGVGQNQGGNEWNQNGENAGNNENQFGQQQQNRDNDQQSDFWGDNNKSGSKKANGWDNDKGQNGGSQGWGNGNDQNNDQNPWEISASNKTQEHGWSGWGNNNEGGGSKNGSGWKQSDNANNGGWGAGGGSNKAGDNGWGGGSHHFSKAEARQTASEANNDEPKAYIKPYWKGWNEPFNRDAASDPNTKKKRDEPREVYNYPAAPLPAVPDNKAKDASHGVKMSKGADYSHKCRKPVYIDTMESPYAVFSFKYRSKDKLEKILKLKIDDVDMKKVQEQVEKDRLMNMPKHQLIEELMNKRAPSKNGSTKNADQSGCKAASGWGNQSAANNNWGANDQDKAGWGARSNHSKSNGSRKSSHHSQDNFATGWDDNQLTNEKAGLGNGWGENKGWDGQNDGANKTGGGNDIQGQWDTPNGQQGANDTIEWVTPDIPGVNLPPGLAKKQKPPAEKGRHGSIVAGNNPRVADRFSDYEREFVDKKRGAANEPVGLCDGPSAVRPPTTDPNGGVVW